MRTLNTPPHPADSVAFPLPHLMTGPEKVGWSWSCSSSYRGLPACCRVAILVRVAMLAAAATPTLQLWEGPEGVCGGFTWRVWEESVS